MKVLTEKPANTRVATNADFFGEHGIMFVFGINYWAKRGDAWTEALVTDNDTNINLLRSDVEMGNVLVSENLPKTFN